MAPKIFITGTTGYIGGDILFVLNQSHPDWEYTALVRSKEKSAPTAAAFPKVRFVYGSLDDSSLLEEEASRADIVIHTADASDHKGAAIAISKGLHAGHSASNPGFWLHTSGTGILCWKDMETETYGEAPSQPPYDDLEGVDKLTSLPDSAFHRDIDQIVLDSGKLDQKAVKTAVICPPTIYGPGRGLVNQRSRQVYNLVEITLKRGRAPQLGKGLTEWDNVHVHDLANLFLLLSEAAVDKKQQDSNELWGPKGYFLAENGHHRWGEVSAAVARAAKSDGYIETDEVQSMDLEDAKKSGGFEAVSWGLNSKGFAKRARKFLGWNPTGKSLLDTIPEIVRAEAKLLGLKPRKE